MKSSQAKTCRALIGPARCGKTRLLLEQYQGMLQSSPLGAALWIAPTARTVHHLHQRLLESGSRGYLRPNIVTFDQFAEAVLRTSPTEFRKLSSLESRQLITRIITQFARDGKIQYLAGIADTPGLIDSVVRFITELKRLEIWPDDLEQGCQARGLCGKDRELVAIYRDYQLLLTKNNLYDSQGLFWSARRLLKEDQQHRLGSYQAVVVDGFTDFTKTQHEILEILAGRSTHFTVSLLCDLSDDRSDLFRKSLDTLQILQDRFADLQIEKVQQSATPTPSAIRHLERNLFQTPDKSEHLSEPANIEIVVASLQRSEIQSIARNIKKRILAGQATADEIAVVFRSLPEVAPLVEEVFADFQLPFVLETNYRMIQSRGMQSLLSILRLELEDWPYRRLLAAMNNSYLHSFWESTSDPNSRAQAEYLVRNLQIPKGKQKLLGRLTSILEKADPPQSDAAVERLEAASATRAMLGRLRDVLQVLPSRASFATWVEAYRQLADELGFVRCFTSTWLDPDKRSSRQSEPAQSTPQPHAAASRAAQFNAALDRLTWEQLQNLLLEAENLADRIGAQEEFLSLGEFLARLQDILSVEQIHNRQNEVGSIRILSAPSVRGLEIPYLYVAGLTERSFPQAESDGRLYTESDYQQLIKAGLPLVDSVKRNQEEMLLFYEVVTRATRQLILSYPSIDSSGHEVSPSSYLLEIQNACGEGVLTEIHESDLSPIPKPEDVSTQQHWRVRAAADSAQGDSDLLARLLATGHRKSPLEHSAENLLHALQLNSARQSGDSFGPYEGILTSDRAAHQLAHQYGSQHLWSPSELERYAECPYKFFAHHALSLAPLPDIRLEEDFLGLGGLLHDALARLHRWMNENRGQLVSPGDHDEAEFFRFYEQALALLVKENEKSDGLWGAMQEIHRRVILSFAADYYRQHQAYDRQWEGHDKPLRPAHFEVRFGPSQYPQENEDRLSSDQPFGFDLGEETIQLTGRIDRIDIGEIAGTPVFSILDYKSGASTRYTKDNIHSGQVLQLPLYALAAQALLSDPYGATPWRAAYWFVKDKGYEERKAIQFAALAEQRLETAGDWQQLQQQVRANVQKFVTDIRSGIFPMFNDDEDCTSHCDFKTVCRVNHVRALDKQWPPPEAQSP